MHRGAISLDRLRALVSYDKETGEILRASGRFSGAPCKNQKMALDGFIYRGAVIAWYYTTGSWPDAPVYCRNGDPTDLRFDNLIVGYRKHGHTSYKAPPSPTWTSWKAMHQRCSNPKNKRWGRYGGRGIKVCEQWADFSSFLADMGERPEGASLDRIDNNGHYEPANCRWADTASQSRTNYQIRLISAHGETMCISDWSRRTGVSAGTIAKRLERGVKPEEAVAKDKRSNRKMTRVLNARERARLLFDWHLKVLNRKFRHMGYAGLSDERLAEFCEEMMSPIFGALCQNEREEAHH